MINKGDNVCRTCQHAKDRFREACFCTNYGIMISYGKTKCKGYKPYPKKREAETA